MWIYSCLFDLENNQIMSIEVINNPLQLERLIQLSYGSIYDVKFNNSLFHLEDIVLYIL